MLRPHTARFIDGIRQLPLLRVLSASKDLLANGWRLYRQRLDKDWGPNCRRCSVGTTQTKPADADATKMFEDARQRLERLSRDRLKVASDFLAYLDEREQSEATEELLSIPGFEDAFRHAFPQGGALSSR